MKIYPKQLLATTGFLLFAAATGAYPAETKIEGLIFGNYGLYTSRYKAGGAPAYDYNSFDIGRVYLTANTKYSPVMASKIVLEGNTLSSGNSVFLKNAFLQWKSGNLTVEGGLPGTLWTGAEEGVWKYRFVEKVQTDLEGVLKAADRGVKAVYALPAGLGSAEAMLTNGEGYNVLEKTDETGKGKDMQLKLATIPSPGLSVSAHYLGAIISGRSRERLVGGVSYQGAGFSAGCSAFKAVDFSTTASATEKFGFSVYGDFPIRPDLSLFARLDSFDPNLSKHGSSEDKRRMLIIGASYELVKDVKLALTGRSITQKEQSAARKNQDVVSVDLLAKF